MKYFTSILLSLIVVSFTSCKDSGSPEAVSRLFLISLNKADFETASGIATKNTNDILKIMAHLTSDKLSEEQKAKRAEQFTVKIIGTRQESDSTMIVSFNTQPAFLPFNQFRLLKQTDKDGRERWKVDISTLDLAGGSDQYNKDPETPADGQFHPQPDSVASKE